MTDCIHSTLECDDRLLRITLDAGRGNVLTTEVFEAIAGALRDQGHEPPVSAILFDHAGEHFSYGASVEEHRLEDAPELLAAFHDLAADLLRSELVLLVAVRGLCLGGGLELASLCDRVFAAPNSSFGQPEIELGVFAPLGSLLLTDLVGRRRAAELLLTGRRMPANEAVACGLASEVAAEPAAAAVRYVEKHILPKSSSSLRAATRAARTAWVEDFLDKLDELESDYLDRLMRTHDANEGIDAFLQKREPRWLHR